MAMMENVRPTEVIMGRLPHGSDLLEAITDICMKRNIRLGRVEALGAVTRARLGFYDQQTREYEYFTLEMPLEIASLVGNISLKEGRPMVHAHVTLADGEGRAFGGHLASGTTIFACEVIIESFGGPVFDRKFDPQTGLALWVDEK